MALNSKTVSINSIIERVFRDTGSVENVDLPDVIEWVGECIELIGAPISCIDKIEVIEVKEGRAFLPCDLYSVLQARDNERKVALRASTDSYHGRHNTETSDLHRDSSLTYRLTDSCMFPNFNTGSIELAYKAIPTDDNGYPTIPDDIKFVKAVEYYIREKIDYKLWRTGKLPQGVYEKTVQDQLWYLGAAQTRSKMPSIDQMENIKNNMIRLIPKINHHSSYFMDFGQPEQRYNNNAGSRFSGDEVDRDEYFGNL
jgi:hypothetical protein